MRILQARVIAPYRPQRLLSTGSLLPVNRELVVALDCHVEELLVLVGGHLEGMAGNIQRPVRRDIPASIRGEDRHPVLRVPVERVDLFRFRVDIDTADHLRLRVCS